MRYISAAEANRSFSKLLGLVRKGETVTVTSHGQPVATLTPAGPDREKSRTALIDRLRQQPALGMRWSRDDLYDE